MKVIKRDGRTTQFDREKIRIAIAGANGDFGEDEGMHVTQDEIGEVVDLVTRRLLDGGVDSTSVEDIQDLVEKTLMDAGYTDVARAYIRYRYDREKERLARTRLIRDFKKKLDGTNIENQNANLDERSFSGRMNEAARILLKDDALKRMSRGAREDHLNNLIYIHDLDSYSSGQHNCLSIPIDDLLKDGFTTRQADVRSPRGVNTALQLVAVIMQLQSLQQFGGVAATHLDWSMVPYVRFTLLKHLVAVTAYEREVEESDVQADLYKDVIKGAIAAGALGDDSLADTKAAIVELAYDNSFDFIKCLTDIYEQKDLCKCLNQAIKTTQKDIHQGAEALYHNLNTLQSRSGQQLPFSSINYGTCTLPEGRWVIDALLDASLDGVGPLHKTPIFPCGIFQYMRGVNDKPGTPNYDMFRKALKSTSLRLYPNYANCDWSTDIAARKQDRTAKQACLDSLTQEQLDEILAFAETYPKKFKALGLEVVDGADRGRIVHVSDKPNPIEIFSTMGCRTSNGIDINYTQFNEDIQRILDGDWEGEFKFSAACQKDGRGNIAPTTIILPEVAMLAGRDVEKFMELLDQKIHDAKNHLLERFEHVCSQHPSSARFMYDNRTMTGFKLEEGVRSAIQHGTIVIGQLGLAETLQLLIGTDQTTPEGMALAKRIEELFKTRCAEFKQKYHQNFGVYYTPAENLCYTAMLKFRDKYGVIENVSDHDYFTNSMHVPVWHDMTPFEKIDIESELTGYSNAGCITYVELDSTTSHNIDALEELVTYAMDHDIPYFAINVPVDTCMDCGYAGEINDACPKCDSDNIQHLRRVTGYLTNDYKTAFNLGKQAEVEDRVKHNGRVDACDIKE